jgi:hypothetical protein
VKKRGLVADKRTCGANLAWTQRQQGTNREQPGAGPGPAGPYVSLSEGELFPGDSGGLAWPGSAKELEGAHASMLVRKDGRFRPPRSHAKIA